MRTLKKKEQKRARAILDGLFENYFFSSFTFYMKFFDTHTEKLATLNF